MKFKDWVLDLFKDERGSTSAKPVLAVICTLFLCVTMTLNSFSAGDVKPSEELVDAVMLITLVCLGTDTADKFSFKKKSAPEPQPEPKFEEGV